MGKSKTQISDFKIQGRLISFILKDGYKLKYLRLETSAGELWIKPAKELRESLINTLHPGDWLLVEGEQNRDYKTGKLKLKAFLVEKLELGKDGSIKQAKQVTQNGDRTQSAIEGASSQDKSPKFKILVCQKSDCCKRGGKAVHNSLVDALSANNLLDQVSIKSTGCLKRCKQGPNVVVMPGKSNYTKVKPQQVPEIVSAINARLGDRTTSNASHL